MSTALAETPIMKGQMEAAAEAQAEIAKMQVICQLMKEVGHDCEQDVG